jgi:hypothetical protein
MVKEGHQWNELFSTFWSPLVSTSILQIQGDTLVSDTTYLKIHRVEFSTGAYLGLFPIGIREDSLGKVYSRKYGSSVEELLYDFSLELNDTVRLAGGAQFEVYNVDSVTINNGERRKRIHLKAGNYGFGPTWVEGIGDVYGGLFGIENFLIFDVSTSLLCFYDNGELLFPKAPKTCFEESTVSVNDIFPSDILIYPNPISNVLHINYEATQLRSISILNLIGAKVYESSFVQEIDVSALEIGTYILLLEDDAGNVYSDKLVKME